MNEIEKAKMAIQEAMLQDPVIHDGMPFYLVIGPALETALETMKAQSELPQDFLVFSQRIALAKLFELWANENGAAKPVKTWRRSCLPIGYSALTKRDGSSQRNAPMKSSESVEFCWPDVGTLAVKPFGEWQASLRFFPSEKAIAEGLLTASRRSAKGDGEGEDKRARGSNE